MKQRTNERRTYAREEKKTRRNEKEVTNTYDIFFITYIIILHFTHMFSCVSIKPAFESVQPVFVCWIISFFHFDIPFAWFFALSMQYAAYSVRNVRFRLCKSIDWLAYFVAALQIFTRKVCWTAFNLSTLCVIRLRFCVFHLFSIFNANGNVYFRTGHEFGTLYHTLEMRVHWASAWKWLKPNTHVKWANNVHFYIENCCCTAFSIFGLWNLLFNANIRFRERFFFFSSLLFHLSLCVFSTENSATDKTKLYQKKSAVSIGIYRWSPVLITQIHVKEPRRVEETRKKKRRKRFAAIGIRLMKNTENSRKT